MDGTTNPEKYGKATMLISVIDGESGRNLVYTWGKNTNGLFGFGETNESVILGDTSDDVPNEISDLFPYYNETTRFTNIGITKSFGYAFATTDGVSYFYTWGENSFGQFGNGETSDVITTTPQLTVPETTFEIEYLNITPNGVDINFKTYFDAETDVQTFDSFEFSGTDIDDSIPNYSFEFDQDEPTLFETNEYGYTGVIHISDLDEFTTYDDWFLTIIWTSPVSLLEAQTFSYKIPSFSTIKNAPTLIMLQQKVFLQLLQK